MTLREIRAMLSKVNVAETLRTQTNEAPRGLSFEATEDKDTCAVSRTIVDGIERIVYLPKTRRYQTPLLMQHGMWHGAWCWAHWQQLFAEWGWESHAFSLPGHAASPTQRPIAQCTLDYYLFFLKAEVDRLPRPPVLMGHSMGGALAQWYLTYVGDLPAAVLVASWLSHDVSGHSALHILARDPWGFLLMLRDGTATPLIRTPHRAAQMFITEGALLSPEELHAQLGPESRLVLLQHHAPMWSPRDGIGTPMLWVAAERDALISSAGAQRAAAFYHATHMPVVGAGHDIMLEASSTHTARSVHAWLTEQSIE